MKSSFFLKLPRVQLSGFSSPTCKDSLGKVNGLSAGGNETDERAMLIVFQGYESGW